MKNTKKISSTIMAMIFLAAIGTTTACGDSGQGGTGTALSLTVYSYGGGFGTEWLDVAAKRFEEKYAEKDFGNGKIGVSIDIVSSKTNGMAEVNASSGSGKDIYFCQEIQYYDAVTQNRFLDITDIVTENLTDKYGENKSIEDKMTQQQQEYYNIDGKYYGIPHYSAQMGITYDIDIFEDELLFFAKDGGFISDLQEERSAGPNGKFGDYDDGLPATYDEFFELCREMKDKTIIPITWSGVAGDGYLRQFISSLYADYEGKEQIMLNFGFSGTANNLIDQVVTNAAGAVTSISMKPATAISNAEGYKLYGQAGRYYALNFLERIYKGGCSVVNSDEGHLEAQYTYLESSLKGEPIGMFIDGNYWLREAQTAGTFDMLVDEYGEGAKIENRRFGFMPLPKANEDRLGKSVLYDYLYTLGFINATIPTGKIEAAKLFLQFVNTDESLREFTTVTNTAKALNYDIGDDYAKLTEFGQTVIDFMKNSDIVYPISKNPMYLANQSSLVMYLNDMWTTTIGGAVVNGVATKICEGSYTAKQVFDGFADYYTQSRWNGQYSEFFN